MPNSQCLPCYNATFLKDNCQPIGNGGLIFTDYRPSQEVLVSELGELGELGETKDAHKYRHRLIKNGQKQRKNELCSVIDKTRCYYMNIPEPCENSENKQ